MATITFSQILDTKISRSSGHVSTELQNEVVILNVKNGKYYNLNAVGSSVWRFIEQPCSVRTILENLLAEYDVERMRCEEDLIRLLRSLYMAGLIEVDGAPIIATASGVPDQEE
jgi:hypothetical protein